MNDILCVVRRIELKIPCAVSGPAVSEFKVQLRVDQSDRYLACINIENSIINIDFSERGIEKITSLIGAMQLHIDGENYPSVEYCLLWIVAHELQHLELGHFELLDEAPTLHLVSQGKRNSRPISKIQPNLWQKIEPCLELQADHDAIELMLGSYSRAVWDEMRASIASISAVMVLIEKHDAENQIEHSTHPKAATRIFQLLGHVTEMWSLPAHAKAKARGETTICEDDLPSDEEKQAFSKEVILPAFWDAVALAEVAEAQSIVSDLGSPEGFFADIARAKLGQWDELVTAGAIEWAELKDANDMILPLLPINQETN